MEIRALPREQVCGQFWHDGTLDSYSHCQWDTHHCRDAEMGIHPAASLYRELTTTSTFWEGDFGDKTPLLSKQLLQLSCISVPQQAEPGWSGTWSVNQAGLELRSTCLCLLSAGIKGMPTNPGHCFWFLSHIHTTTTMNNSAEISVCLIFHSSAIHSQGYYRLPPNWWWHL